MMLSHQRLTMNTPVLTIAERSNIDAGSWFSRLSPPLRNAILSHNRLHGGLENERLTPTEAATGFRLSNEVLRIADGRLVIEGCLDDADTIPEDEIPPVSSECPPQ